jgi:hypothetical protein
LPLASGDAGPVGRQKKARADFILNQSDINGYGEGEKILQLVLKGKTYVSDKEMLIHVEVQVKRNKANHVKVFLRPVFLTISELDSVLIELK